MRRSGYWLAVAAVAGASIVGCQKLEDDDPPTPTAPGNVSSSAPGDPNVVLGNPNAPAPTPSPEPGAPEPTSTPEPPASGSCRLPPSNPTNPTCNDSSPRLVGEVEAALDMVTERFPELFDFDDAKCETCYFVRDPQRYFDEVIKQLSRQGLCTDGVREELGIKSSNDFSEQYDVILASDHMRRAPGSYRGACRPAIF